MLFAGIKKQKNTNNVYHNILASLYTATTHARILLNQSYCCENQAIQAIITGHSVYNQNLGREISNNSRNQRDIS